MPIRYFTIVVGLADESENDLNLKLKVSDCKVSTLTGQFNTIVAQGEDLEEFLEEELSDTTKENAEKLHNAIDTVFADPKFDKLRELITRGEKNNKKKFSKIDCDAFNKAVKELSGDDLALAKIVAHAINSDKDFDVEFLELTDNLTNTGTEAFNAYIDKKLKPSSLPEERSAKEIFWYGGSGLTIPSEDGGSYSYILEGAGVINSGGKVELDVFHETFGHGIPTGLNLTNQENTVNAIRLENLTRRVMGISEQRDGSNHGGGLIENPSALPIINELDCN